MEHRLAGAALAARAVGRGWPKVPPARPALDAFAHRQPRASRALGLAVGAALNAPQVAAGEARSWRSRLRPWQEWQIARSVPAWWHGRVRWQTVQRSSGGCQPRAAAVTERLLGDSRATGRSGARRAVRSAVAAHHGLRGRTKTAHSKRTLSTAPIRTTPRTASSTAGTGFGLALSSRTRTGNPPWRVRR